MSAEVITFALTTDAGSALHTFALPKNKLDATAAPGVGDDDADGYVAGSLWMDRTNDKGYLCTDNATGAAVWVQIAPGSGGLADGDYGDITVSSSGTAFTIDAGVVTYAKMQDVSATDKLLGRSSSGSGDVEEIACTAFARTILDDADAAAVRATIGAGTGSGSGTVTSVATGSGLTGGTITGSGTIAVDITGLTAITSNLDLYDDLLLLYDNSATANKKVALRYIKELFESIITPPGLIVPYAGTDAPDGYLECDGSAVSRTTYANLFDVIETTWGAGNGSTTFNLPDLRGRTLIGVGTGSGLTARTLATTGGTETHTLAASELPAHKHQVKSPNGSTMYKTGGGASNNVLSVASVGIGAAYETEDNSGGGGAHANMQPWAAVKWLIKI